MGGVSIERQLVGQAHLVRLLLWRVGNSTDIDVCLQAARENGMIDGDDEDFLRICMQAEEETRDAAGGGVNGNKPGETCDDAPGKARANAGASSDADADADADENPMRRFDEQDIQRLRRCADKLNRADSA